MLPQPPHGAALFLFCRGKHKRAASLDAICLAVAHGLERRSKSYLLCVRWLAYELHFRPQHFDAQLRLCFGQMCTIGFWLIRIECQPTKQFCVLGRHEGNRFRFFRHEAQYQNNRLSVRRIVYKAIGLGHVDARPCPIRNRQLSIVWETSPSTHAKRNHQDGAVLLRSLVPLEHFDYEQVSATSEFSRSSMTNLFLRTLSRNSV